MSGEIAKPSEESLRADRELADAAKSLGRALADRPYRTSKKLNRENLRPQQEGSTDG